MMMRYAPFISAPSDQHGEARRTRNRFAIDHPSKSIKASDHNGVIVDYAMVRRSSIVFLLPLPLVGVK
jgi:hypothetical protein